MNLLLNRKLYLRPAHRVWPLDAGVGDASTALQVQQDVLALLMN